MARTAWAPSLTRRILRHRVTQGGIALVASITAFVLIGRQWSEADAARYEWGASTWVFVVIEPVAAGAALEDSVERVERPVAMVPSGSVQDLESEARAGVDLVPGEIVLEARVAGRGDDAVPARTRAMAVRIGDAGDLVEPGDLVDLWSTDITSLTAQPVVQSVVVLDRDDDVLTIAVPDDDVERVAVASLRPLTVARH